MSKEKTSQIRIKESIHQMLKLESLFERKTMSDLAGEILTDYFNKNSNYEIKERN